MSPQAKDVSLVKQAISILENFLAPERRERFHAVIDQRTDDLTLVLECTHHPHNISAVIRSADAFGLQTIHFVGTNLDISTPISVGSERWIDIVHHSSVTACIDALRTRGYRLVVFTPPHGDELSVHGPTAVSELPYSTPLALVYGNEKDGVSQEFLDFADIHAFIPMYGFAESFNISVAVAISLFCSTLTQSKQLRVLTPLSEQRRDEVLLSWLMDEVRGSKQILERYNINDK